MIPDVPKIIRIEKKKTIVVECHVKAQSEPNVLWYKEQSVVQKSSKHMVHINRVSEVTIEIILYAIPEVETPYFRLINNNI